jgi:hypothetical protein
MTTYTWFITFTILCYLKRENTKPALIHVLIIFVFSNKNQVVAPQVKLHAEKTKMSLEEAKVIIGISMSLLIMIY